MYKYTICFLYDGDKVLLLNRNKAPLFGMWNGVGGKLELGETPVQGILREIDEETTLELMEKDIRFAGTVTWIVDGAALGGMYAFVAKLPDGAELQAPVETEEGILAWKPMDWIMHPDNRGIAAHVPQFLPVMLESLEGFEHRFEFWDGRLLGGERFPITKRDEMSGQTYTAV
jgi:8-oxo-dGTP diphosphatase